MTSSKGYGVPPYNFPDQGRGPTTYAADDVDKDHDAFEDWVTGRTIPVDDIPAMDRKTLSLNEIARLPAETERRIRSATLRRSAQRVATDLSLRMGRPSV